MKSQKLLVITAIVSLLVGPSRAALAQDPVEKNTCPLGAIPGKVVAGNLVVTSEDCMVQCSIITGNVIVNNLVNPSAVFHMHETIIAGRIKVTGQLSDLKAENKPAPSP